MARLAAALLIGAVSLRGAHGSILWDFIERLRGGGGGIQAPSLPGVPQVSLLGAPPSNGWVEPAAPSPGIAGVAAWGEVITPPTPAPEVDYAALAAGQTTKEPVKFTTARLDGTPPDGTQFTEKEVLKQDSWSVGDTGSCNSRFTAPPQAPVHATDLNGIRLPDVCIQGSGPFHIFAIGDWGGVLKWGDHVEPADHRSALFQTHHRPFVIGADDVAQQNVAAAMKERAPTSRPDYVLNVGDNFYWGGLAYKCGAPAYRVSDATRQWLFIFEKMYSGDGLDGKQWVGVLGNHDYGGWMFTMGWDQAIAYTWARSAGLDTSTDRWMTPAQYYSARVRYPDFTVDYFFLDNNVFDAFAPDDQPHHNMCSREHNPISGATCGQMGPVSIEDCPGWFQRLWDAEVVWLENGLAKSDADWQILVQHFPPEGSWGMDVFTRFSKQYGVDLVVAGHRHKQSFEYMGLLGATGILVTGGGGGITSENVPSPDGVDDEYGFSDITINKHEIMVEMISHKGQLRSTTCITPRARGADNPTGLAVGPSMCEGRVARGEQAHVPAADSGFLAWEPGMPVVTTPDPTGAYQFASEGVAAAAPYAAEAQPQTVRRLAGNATAQAKGPVHV